MTTPSGPSEDALPCVHSFRVQCTCGATPQVRNDPDFHAECWSHHPEGTPCPSARDRSKGGVS